MVKKPVGVMEAPIPVELPGGAELSTEYLGVTIYVLAVGIMSEAFVNSA